MLNECSKENDGNLEFIEENEKEGNEKNDNVPSPNKWSKGKKVAVGLSAAAVGATALGVAYYATKGKDETQKDEKVLDAGEKDETDEKDEKKK